MRKGIRRYGDYVLLHAENSGGGIRARLKKEKGRAGRPLSRKTILNGRKKRSRTQGRIVLWDEQLLSEKNKLTIMVGEIKKRGGGV